VLVRRSLAGDATAYTALVDRYFDAAFAVARRLTTSLEDAEDACQEALARAYFRLERCGEPEKFGPWLMQIVRHHAHNVRRYQALRAAVSLDEAPEPASPIFASREAEESELRARLQISLAALSPAQRAVLRHHEVDGWTHAQISASLGISVLMSRRHLSDARALLRETLGDTAKDFLPGKGDDD
jgi:RNA polymerase sigma-70 factor (ECF subfamily)